MFFSSTPASANLAKLPLDKPIPPWLKALVDQVRDTGRLSTRDVRNLETQFGGSYKQAQALIRRINDLLDAEKAEYHLTVFLQFRPGNDGDVAPGDISPISVEIIDIIADTKASGPFDCGNVTNDVPGS